MPPKTTRKIEALLRNSTKIFAATSAAYLASEYALINQTQFNGILELAYKISGSVLSYNLPYYLSTITQNATAIMAGIVSLLFILCTTSSKDADAPRLAIFTISILMILAPDGMKNLAYPALVVAITVLGTPKKPPLSMRNNGLRLPENSHLLLVFVALAALLWYPFLTDIRLGSSAWMIYKKTTEVYKTGYLQQDDFSDNRFSLYPPLVFYALAAGKRLLGMPTMETLRIFFAISNVMLIAISYLLARKMGGGWFAAVTVMLVSFMPKLVSAPAYGNYAQLASNSLALLSLLFFIKYLEDQRIRHMAVAAVFFSLTMLTHWLLTIILGAFYLAYLPGIAIKNKKSAAVFAIIVAGMTLPYLAGLAKNALQSENTSWFAIKMAQSEGDAGLLNLALPTGSIGNIRYLLLAFGITGLLLGRCDRELRPLYLLILLPTAGYLLFQDYVTFFYPTRYLFYIQFFFSFFISYGILKTIKKSNLVFSIAFTVLLLYAAHQQITVSTKLAKGEQPLGRADFAAAMWLKENAESEEVIAADALRMELVHGFTGKKVATPQEAVESFERPGGLEKAHYLYLSEAGTCGFPCSREIQLRKDTTLTNRWAELAYSDTIAKIKKNGLELAFSEGPASIYLAK